VKYPPNSENAKLSVCGDLGTLRNWFIARMARLEAAEESELEAAELATLTSMVYRSAMSGARHSDMVVYTGGVLHSRRRNDVVDQCPAKD
jgi:hypothetical protein